MAQSFSNVAHARGVYISARLATPAGLIIQATTESPRLLGVDWPHIAMSFDDGPADRLLLPLTLRPALAAELGAASVSHGIAEWASVWA